MTYEQIYATESFQMLAKGMKDREALEIVTTLYYMGGLTGLGKLTPFELFERYAKEQNDSQPP